MTTQNGTNAFEFTPDGYQKALHWLKQNQLEHLIEKEMSTDGYTVVALANNLYLKKSTDEPWKSAPV